MSTRHVLLVTLVLGTSIPATAQSLSGSRSGTPLSPTGAPPPTAAPAPTGAPTPTAAPLPTPTAQPAVISNPVAAPPSSPPPFANGYPPPPSSPSAGYPAYVDPRAGWPMTLKYDSNAPPPPGYRLDERPRTWLLVPGAVVFGVPYLVSATIAGASTSPADRWLLLPIVGPAGTLVSRQNHCDRRDGLDCAANTLIILGLVADAIVQGIGAGAFGAAFLLPQKEWVRDIARTQTPRFTWRVLPRAEAHSVGLTLTGTVD